MRRRPACVWPASKLLSGIARIGARCNFLVQSVPLGMFLGACSAFLFSTTQVALSRQLIKIDARVVNYVGSLFGTLVLALAAGFSFQLGDLLLASPSTALIFLAVGAAQFGLARLLTYVSIRHIGANQSTTIFPTQVLYSFLFAVVLLQERLLPLTLIGGVLVAIGPFIGEARRGASVRSGSLRIGLASAALTGLIFGLTPILINEGLAGYPHYLDATLVSYMGALIFNSFVSKPRETVSKFMGYQKSSIRVVVFVGILTAVAQLSRFAALNFAPVVFVVPFVAMYPTFTLLLSSLFVRDVEASGLRTIISVACVTSGAAMVAFSS